MIDNLICDPTKQIYINLELYFERYDFSNLDLFRIFLFFMNLFGFILNQKN